ncbi:MAG: hypothetical protein LR001_07170 [Clostridiales bacterium]|nr:hypothetical protein [Clostridiales bacterium]
MYKVNDFKLIEPLIKENTIANLNALGRIRNNKNVNIYVDSLNCEELNSLTVEHFKMR